jgi:hypothetical protein
MPLGLAFRETSCAVNNPVFPHSYTAGAGAFYLYWPSRPNGPVGFLTVHYSARARCGLFFRGTFHPAILDPLMLQQSPESPPQR